MKRKSASILKTCKLFLSLSPKLCNITTVVIASTLYEVLEGI
jgi:hypothetical protein